MHPGGLSVLLDREVGVCLDFCFEILFMSILLAGKDATDAFFSLHRLEVLQRPQYARLQIGLIAGGQEQIRPRAAGDTSDVPYAEPTWLTKGYHSPYFSEVRHHFVVMQV
jgi:hypothetical protein